jgi:hypothetical protein
LGVPVVCWLGLRAWLRLLSNNLRIQDRDNSRVIVGAILRFVPETELFGKVWQLPGLFRLYLKYFAAPRVGTAHQLAAHLGIDLVATSTTRAINDEVHELLPNK